MNYEPIDNKVVLKQVKQLKTTGGIIVPEMGQNKTMECEVIAIGPGLLNRNITDTKLLTSNKTQSLRYPMNVKVGDIVVVPKFSLYEFEEKGEKYYVGKEEEILFIKR